VADIIIYAVIEKPIKRSKTRGEEIDNYGYSGLYIEDSNINLQVPNMCQGGNWS